MKKKLSVGVIVLTLISLAACQEGLSSSSSSSSSSSDIISSHSESSPISSSSNSNVYYPINPSSAEINVFSKDLVFELNLNKISEEAAQELVANDISKYPEEKSANKRTSYTIKREETHVTENRTTATYSLKDYFEEKFTVNKIDSDNKWSYRRMEEYAKTVYFVEDTLIRHSVVETLYFVKDNYLYDVHAEKTYYEGMENKGTYEAYYTKTDDFNIDDYGGWFGINLEGYTYFNSTSGFNRIDKSVYDNLFWSSSYYTADDYKLVERDTNYEYYSSGGNGSFGCIVNDKGDYRFGDLKDYPTMEKKELDTISYSQDYLLSISDYFTFEENSLVKSISRTANKEKVIRDETKENRMIVTDECEIFYPDLSKFKEREITPPITK